MTNSSTATGQFHTSNMGNASIMGCPVVNGSTLFYLTTNSSNAVKVVTGNLSALQSGNVSGVTGNSNWSKAELSGKISKSNGANFVTNFAPTAVALGSRIYYFWVDTRNSGQAYMAYQDQLGNYSSCAYKIDIQGASSISALVLTSSISANIAPNGTTITLGYFNTSSTTLHTVALDPASIDDTNSRWVGLEASTLQPSNYGLNAVSKNYSTISSAWFTQGSLGNFAVTSFYSSADHHVYFLLYPISDDGTPAYTGTSYVFPIADFAAKRGVYLTRDPAGRLYGIFCKNDSSYNLYSTTFNTYQQVQQDDSGNHPTLSWNTAQLLNNSSKNSEKGPTAAFMVGNGTSSTIQLKNSNNQNQTFSCTNYPQYSITIYADDNQDSNAYDIQVQIASYGTSVVVPNYSTIGPNPTYASNRILSLLMDSFPVPNENLGNNVSPNKNVVEYAYGAASTNELSATMSVDIKFGVKASFSTTKGVGPATEDEFKTGPQASLSASTQTTTFSSFAVDTTPIVAPAGFATTYKIESHGGYYGSTPSNIVEDSAIFKDADGTIISGSQAPLFSSLRTVKANSTSEVSGQYSTYCYTPGNITSYQENNINAAMAAKYNALTAAQKSYFTTGYASNYVQDVIAANATQFGTSSDDKYLEFTFSSSGHSATTMEQINQIVATLGWTVEGSYYVGVSGGEEVSVFGFGEGFSASLMAGFEYNFSVAGGTTVGSTWGIYFNSNMPTAVNGALGYTVRMYLCKPNNMWAREMQLFSGNGNTTAYSSIDFENSAPMKIMFVVSNIVTGPESSR